MKLYSRAWVRRVQKSGGLPAPSWRRRLGYWRGKSACLRVIAPVILAGMSHAAPWSADSLHVLTGWLLLLLLYRTVQLSGLLSFTRDALPLYLLPVGDTFAFAFFRDRFVRRSLWVALDGFAFFLGAAGVHLFLPQIVFMAGVALLLWALHLSSTLLLAYVIHSVPERVQRYLTWGLWLSLLLLVATLVGNLRETRATFFTPALETFNVVAQERTPIGWSTSWANWSLASRDLPAPPAATAAGLALLLLIAPWSYGQLRRLFRFRLPDEADPPLFDPDDEDDEYDRPPPQKEDPEWVESFVLSRDWLSPPDKDQPGLIEHLVWKGWTLRQKALAGLVHRQIDWTGNYRQSWIYLLLLSLASLPLYLWVSPLMTGWCLAFGGFIIVIMQFPAFGGEIGVLEKPVFLWTGNTALCSLLPVGISELEPLFRRACYLRHLAALPAFLWLTVLFAAYFSASWTSGLLPALLLWLTSLAIAPGWFILKISALTRDTRTSFRMTLSFFGIGFVAMLLMMSLPVLYLAEGPWWASFLLLFLLALVVRGFAALYLRWYRRARFDLIAAAQSR